MKLYPSSSACPLSLPAGCAPVAPAAEDCPADVRVPCAACWCEWLKPMLGPLLLLLALTAVFRLSSVDLAISGLFFDATARDWPYSNAHVYRGIGYLYSYGPWPGVAMGVAGLVVGLLSYSWRRLRPWRAAGFFLAATLAIGPGLLINLVVKPWFERPRPRHTVPFGGDQAFLRVWERAAVDAPDTVGQSFPSGHASVGFLLMTPAFLLTRRHPRWAAAFLLLGLTWGCVVGLGRVAQGDHFASDVLWSGGLVYLTAYVLSRLFPLQASPQP